MTLDDWCAELAAELELSDVRATLDITALLDTTRDVAHGIARPAGPLTTFLIGLAIGSRPEATTGELCARASALAARLCEEQA